MKKYLFQITATYVTNNKLQEELYNYVNGLDRTLLNSSEERTVFHQRLRNKAHELSQKHSRCKEIVIDEYFDAKDRIFRAPGWHAVITHIEHEFKA